MATQADVRRIALKLSETEEATAWRIQAPSKLVKAAKGPTETAARKPR